MIWNHISYIPAFISKWLVKLLTYFFLPMRQSSWRWLYRSIFKNHRFVYGSVGRKEKSLKKMVNSLSCSSLENKEFLYSSRYLQINHKLLTYIFSYPCVNLVGVDSIEAFSKIIDLNMDLWDGKGARKWPLFCVQKVIYLKIKFAIFQPIHSN